MVIDQYFIYCLSFFVHINRFVFSKPQRNSWNVCYTTTV